MALVIKNDKDDNDQCIKLSVHNDLINKQKALVRKKQREVTDLKKEIDELNTRLKIIKEDKVEEDTDFVDDDVIIKRQQTEIKSLYTKLIETQASCIKSLLLK